MPKMPWKGSLRYLGRWKKSFWHNGFTRDAVITFPDGLQRRAEATVFAVTNSIYFRYVPPGDRFTYRVNFAHSLLKEHPITGSAKSLEAAKLRAGKALEQLTRDFA